MCGGSLQWCEGSVAISAKDLPAGVLHGGCRAQTTQKGTGGTPQAVGMSACSCPSGGTCLWCTPSISLLRGTPVAVEPIRGWTSRRARCLRFAVLKEPGLRSLLSVPRLCQIHPSRSCRPCACAAVNEPRDRLPDPARGEVTTSDTATIPQSSHKPRHRSPSGRRVLAEWDDISEEWARLQASRSLLASQNHQPSAGI